MNVKIVARNYRGFKKIYLDVGDVNFIVGDNSSGKSSLVYLVSSLLSTKFLRGHQILGAVDQSATIQDILSPYIDDKVVTVAVFFNDPNTDEDMVNRFPIGRMITYKADKVKNELNIERITALNGKNCMSVRKIGSEFFRKKIKLDESSENYFRIIREHHKPRAGYRRHRLKDQTISDWDFAFFDIDDENKSIAAPHLISFPPLYAQMYGPIRLDPQRSYAKQYRSRRARGDHIPHELHRVFEGDGEQSIEVRKSINEFGRESGLFDELVVSRYKKSDLKSPIKIEVIKNGKTFSLDEVGYGVSQILPVIADAYLGSTEYKRVMLIQQPELHLHPRAQAAFGELVYKLSSRGLRFVIETHSDYLVDRYRYCLFKRKGRSEIKSQLFFCENTLEGNKVARIKIKQNGSIDSAPAGYRNFFLKEEDSIFEMI